MKIIITEDQSNKLISFRRRIKDIMRVASDMVDDADRFYGNLDFCRYYPTLKKYVDDVVYEIINQYEHPSYDIDETENFIYNNIGYENFVNILMDMYGEKIENFYNEKTKDC
jgi:hypothetical protein